MPGTPATAEDQNTQDQDIADGLTQCVTKDGQSPLKGNLDMGGFKIVELGPATDPTDAVNYSQLLDFVPVGVVFDWPAASPPTNYFLCQGQSISRTTYATLFALIGTTYGAGDGSTTFNIPDTHGRVVASIDPTGSILTSATMTPNGNTLGALGGTEEHTLITAELAAHTHTANVTDPGHDHTYNDQPNLSAAVGVAVASGTEVSTNTGTSVTGITVTNTSTGSGTAHLNMQPTILMNKIIKVL